MTSFLYSSFLLAVLTVSAISAEKTGWSCRGEKPQAEYIPKGIELTCRKGDGSGEMINQERPDTKLHVCAWEKLGVLSDNKVSESGFKKVFKKVLPTNGQALGDRVYDACITKTPSNVANLSKDDDYKSYDPLVICIFKKIQEFCIQEHE